jgi:hypothetical protein
MATKARILVCLGTRGLGDGMVSRIGHEGVPKDVHPVAEIAFPARQAGGKSIIRKVVGEPY